MAEVKRVLLIITGSVAAYKAMDVIRRLKERGVEVNAILTRGGAEFVTPLLVSSLTGTKTYTDLFSLKDEVEMGHIRLVREADAVLVAPATADVIAKLAGGMADDLASTALLASRKPLLIAPAMNVAMWEHAATQRNVKQVVADGAELIEPGTGSMACGEEGVGRMADAEEIVARVLAVVDKA